MCHSCYFNCKMCSPYLFISIACFISFCFSWFLPICFLIFCLYFSFLYIRFMGVWLWFSSSIVTDIRSQELALQIPCLNNMKHNLDHNGRMETCFTNSMITGDTCAGLVYETMDYSNQRRSPEARLLSHTVLLSSSHWASHCLQYSSP
jgi:hypothetical protein